MIPNTEVERGEAPNLAKRSPIVIHEYWRFCGGTYGAARGFSGEMDAVSRFLAPEAREIRASK